EDLAIETKPDLTPVTEADRAVERAVRARLADVRPADSVLGEEYGTSAPDGPGSRRWIVDPIDGTKNYVRGIPVWATLLALQEGEDVTVGVGSAPVLRRPWGARKGGGDGAGPARRPRRPSHPRPPAERAESPTP